MEEKDRKILVEMIFLGLTPALAATINTVSAFTMGVGIIFIMLIQDPEGDRGLHQASRPAAEQQDADLPAEERHRLPRFSHLPHEHGQGGQKSEGQEHRQHEAEDPQVSRPRGLRQDDARERPPVLRELVRPYFPREHLPPAAEHGRLLLRLLPGAEANTERRKHTWPKN